MPRNSWLRSLPKTARSNESKALGKYTIMEFAADSILVLLDTNAEGGLAKSSAALLGAAASVGTPVALVISDDEALAAQAADLGAVAVLRAGVAPELGRGAADALAAAAALVNPDAVLVSH